MEKKNLLKLSLAGVSATICTLGAVFGVWASAQDTLTATDKVSFVADPYVDAKVSDGTNHYVFSSTNTTDDNQTGTFINISEADWKPVENSIKETAQIVLTITNTSDIDTNVLVYSITNDWAVDETKCTLDVVHSSKTKEIAKGESATITYTFTADGRYDFEQDISWSVSLSARK